MGVSTRRPDPRLAIGLAKRQRQTSPLLTGNAPGPNLSGRGLIISTESLFELHNFDGKVVIIARKVGPPANLQPGDTIFLIYPTGIASRRPHAVVAKATFRISYHFMDSIAPPPHLLNVGDGVHQGGAYAMSLDIQLLKPHLYLPTPRSWKAGTTLTTLHCTASLPLVYSRLICSIAAATLILSACRRTFDWLGGHRNVHSTPGFVRQVWASISFAEAYTPASWPWAPAPCAASATAAVSYAAESATSTTGAVATSTMCSDQETSVMFPARCAPGHDLQPSRNPYPTTHVAIGKTCGHRSYDARH